ncbi:hypothetical protein SDC9_175512 [bioreactor metagenome]|uniref:Uncharacterized protein n=1 Tax=bioreactor metagenome TaxID=1076179 RepID=A0A645GWP5_9ZZZZ
MRVEQGAHLVIVRIADGPAAGVKETPATIDAQGHQQGCAGCSKLICEQPQPAISHQINQGRGRHQIHAVKALADTICKITTTTGHDRRSPGFIRRRRDTRRRPGKQRGIVIEQVPVLRPG